MAKILVVDDSAICREPIVEALRHNGFDAVPAASGEEALVCVREAKPDAILLDVTMPGLDGLGVLRRIRHNPQWRSIPVIFLTDKSDRELIMQAAEVGLQGFLLKSNFSLKELLARVASCLATPAGVTEGASPVRYSADETRPPGESRRGDVPVGRGAGNAPPPTPANPASPAVSLPSASATSPQAAKSLAELTPVITEAELLRRIKRGLELQPLGPTSQNVITVTSRAECSADDVAKAVSQDQALSIRVLRLANSSAYSRGRAVDSVQDAVKRIGIREVRHLVMTLGVMTHFEKHAIEFVDPHLFWEHSISCGLIASAIAKARGARNVDEYFLWGMIHDVGRLILLEHAPEAVASVREVSETLDLPLEVVEAKLLTLDHCDILQRALEHWQFPQEFIGPIVNHHKSPSTLKRLGPQQVQAAAILALANRLTHALVLGSSGNDVIYPLEELVGLVGVQPGVIIHISQTVPNEARDLKCSMLARAKEDTWAEFLPQLKKELGSEPRLLNISSQSEPDAFRLFVGRLSRCDSEGEPNLAVIYLADTAQYGAACKNCESAEEAAKVQGLPVVLIWNKGAFDLNDSWLRARPHVALKAPVRMRTFIAAAQNLLGPPPR